MNRRLVTMEGNEAVAYVAYQVSEVAAIYPITPSSPMAESCDEWSAATRPNIWGTIPSVTEMQSEGGASAALHGALQTGSLATTFTASQGLLLMIPTMYKVAGELLPTVFHITARTLATHALSIFGDHSDVMACRATGFGMLASGSVQEAHDLALITHTATLESRVPFLHFFDGFRTSHEVSKIELLNVDDLKAMISDERVREHRARAMTPDRPVLRGTAQNPDVFFQARETVNSFYAACPDLVQKAMDKFAALTGRAYHLFDYFGAPDAERVIVIMCSGADIAHETVEHLLPKGEKVGVLKVRLYRPFDSRRFCEALPATVKSIAVMDRTKEPGAGGEPLYMDVVTALKEGVENGWGKLKAAPKTVGGRYGLSSKEFTPAMVKGIFDNLAQAKPKNHFTVGINDDVTHTSIAYDPAFSTEGSDVIRALFYGLGADGTVGANKNSIKIIGENTPNYAQGYFSYDSRKSGAITVSHLRFGPKGIRSSYLVTKANFIACHQPVFLERYDMLKTMEQGGVFLLNTHYSAGEIWNHLPRRMQQQMIERKVKFFVIDAYKVAKDAGMGGRINTVMQTCFFAISQVLPRDAAIEQIRKSIKKAYGKKGEEIVQMNLNAVDHTLAHMHEVKVPAQVSSATELPPAVSAKAPEFVRNVLGAIGAGDGDMLPVSAMPLDGTFPTATSQWDKRNIALSIPVWDPVTCIQCAKCAIVCPHAVIRIKAYDEALLKNAPATFKSTAARDPEWKGLKFTLQIAPEDCTGCEICVSVCPAKNKKETRLKAINMAPQEPLRDPEKANWEFFQTLPNPDRRKVKVGSIRQQQSMLPLFEFSSACAGCGETPYLKLVSQLFGDRMIVANATGCSSIYGGNLPTTPWAKDANGRGPAWCNSLFEDNAEFGMGYRISIDKQKEFAGELLKKLGAQVGDELVSAILGNPQKDEADIADQRERVAMLKERLQKLTSNEDAKRLLDIADMLVKKSVWIIGGDGWAYDIGYGGLDHVIASGKNVNLLVMDTEVYSNTGGQMSKSTPRAAVAKFAAGGKPAGKKDLGLIAMTYGNVYVASVAMGARDEHTLKAFIEAEAYDGPSLIIAYSHCIAQGFDLSTGMAHQKAAVESGQWLLYRFNPALAAQGLNPLSLDSKPPKVALEQYLYSENRFKMLTKSKPEEAKRLLAQAQKDVEARYAYYEYLAARTFQPAGGGAAGAMPAPPPSAPTA
ncbi:MAG: pyruvate:ferredoxin (flavodoxin) oxidoreductase [Verrucomicrobia bacterium]|nr:pyruvate:ferredoxin (flavodoxin) oxidoreductase [Verrucomicrobiota bacterium]